MDYVRANRIRINIEEDHKAIALATKEVRALEEELRSFCTHPDNMVKHTENYVSGSYNDTACTYHYYHCGICDTKLKEETESHSWYG